MLHLIKYDYKIKLHSFNLLFWPLVFPLALGTFFYIAFHNMGAADLETIPIAVVQAEEAEGIPFIQFLDALEQDEKKLVSVKEMKEKEAISLLKKKEISGIFYAESEPTLTVSGVGIQESVLQSLLENYLNGKRTLEKIMAEHAEGMEAAVRQMSVYEDLVSQESLGGKTINGTAQYYYALIAMACLYGCFIGLDSAQSLKANLSAFAARKGVTSVPKIKLIFSEMFTSFTIHIVNVMILLFYLRYVLNMDFKGEMSQMTVVVIAGSMIGVSMGTFISSFNQYGEGVKVAIMLGVSMVCSFFAGLMSSNVKDIVEQNIPLLNRINPAAVIADMFYCINVYDDPDRFRRGLYILITMSVVLTVSSFLAIRRERYDSI